MPEPNETRHTESPPAEWPLVLMSGGDTRDTNPCPLCGEPYAAEAAMQAYILLPSDLTTEDRRRLNKPVCRSCVYHHDDATASRAILLLHAAESVWVDQDLPLALNAYRVEAAETQKFAALCRDLTAGRIERLPD